MSVWSDKYEDPQKTLGAGLCACNHSTEEAVRWFPEAGWSASLTFSEV